MIELAKHIEILLLDNDCVIVPDLGGFITHYQPAHYEEDEGVYSPPLRTVGFNPQLTMNDGLLVQSYMQAYHTDYPDAIRIITEKVESLKETLHKEGVVEMQGIGVLHYTLYGMYEFRPYDNGALSPALYALDAFSIAPLSAEVVVDEPVVSGEPEVSSELPKKVKREIHLNTQWLSNAVAVAVAAILFFVLSVPVENTYVDKGVYASLGTDCLFDAIRTQSMATTLSVFEVEEPQQKKNVEIIPITTKVERVASVSQPEESVKPDKKETPVPAPKKEDEKTVEAPKVKETPKAEPRKAVASSKKKYHIIVASLTTVQDAQRMLQEYKKQGYKDASVMESNGRFRISLCHHTDKTQAYSKLDDLKQNDAFKSAWMLTSK